MSISNLFYFNPRNKKAIGMFKEECPIIPIKQIEEKCDLTTGPIIVAIYKGPVKGGTLIEGQSDNYVRQGNPVSQMFRTNPDSDNQSYFVATNEIDNYDEDMYERLCLDTDFAHWYDFSSKRRFIMIDSNGNGCGGREGDDWGYSDWQLVQN